MYNYDTLNDFITSISACINAYLCTLTGIMLIYDDFHHLIRRKTTGILMETNLFISGLITGIWVFPAFRCITSLSEFLRYLTVGFPLYSI